MLGNFEHKSCRSYHSSAVSVCVCVKSESKFFLFISQLGNVNVTNFTKGLEVSHYLPLFSAFISRLHFPPSFPAL